MNTNTNKKSGWQEMLLLVMKALMEEKTKIAKNERKELISRGGKCHKTKQVPCILMRGEKIPLP